LPAEGATLLIAAISARSLAQAARRAGFTPLAVDFFADADMQDAALACRKIGGSLSRGFRAESLLRALEALAARAPSPPAGFVYGAGFEDRPELLRSIAERWPVLGNAARTVARLKAPEIFFSELDRLGIPHPRTVTRRPGIGGAWLAKKIGGAGGSHIGTPLPRGDDPNVYYQQRIDGRAVSAQWIGNGKDARVLGFSEQWTAPTAKSPWRYGGAARPTSGPAAMFDEMTRAVRRLVGAFGIRGLGSADFLVNEADAFLLEVNPRPGATLDIFDCGATPLLQLHLEAICEAKLPPRAFKFADATASAIVYAEAACRVPAEMSWPDWTADRPKSSEWIDKNRPICTVLARAATRRRARRLIEERACKILAGLQSGSRGEDREQKGRHRRSATRSADERQRQGGAARQSAHR
jgi:predicted ATP-grasp superfamily ATP-dependent carboligase